MIFYFTGTGNSLYLASCLAKAQGEKLISIAKEFDKKDNPFSYELHENEMIGFVYPVYAWAPPQMVLDFIKLIKIKGTTPYVFSVASCGEEEGNTTKILEKALCPSNLELDSAFTVCMPNNYIIGFDVDSEEVEKKRLEEAEQKLDKINMILAARKKDKTMLIPGKHPVLKSSVINYGFNHFARNTKKFYADDKCTLCRLCEKVCPVHSIELKEKPVWGQNCTMCLACINRCPAKAIQYGASTYSKGRYYHPKIDELENDI